MHKVIQQKVVSFDAKLGCQLAMRKSIGSLDQLRPSLMAPHGLLVADHLAHQGFKNGINLVRDQLCMQTEGA